MTTSPLEQLDQQVADLLTTIGAFTTLEDLVESEPEIIGRRSLLSKLLKSGGAVEPDERREAGARLQDARRVVESALQTRRDALAREKRLQDLEHDRLDLGDVVVETVRWTPTPGHPGTRGEHPASARGRLHRDGLSSVRRTRGGK